MYGVLSVSCTEAISVVCARGEDCVRRLRVVRVNRGTVSAGLRFSLVVNDEGEATDLVGPSVERDRLSRGQGTEGEALLLGVT